MVWQYWLFNYNITFPRFSFVSLTVHSLCQYRLKFSICMFEHKHDCVCMCNGTAISILLPAYLSFVSFLRSNKLFYALGVYLCFIGNVRQNILTNLMDMVLT